MPAATVAGGGQGQGGAQKATIPFLAGSWEYTEVQATDTITLDSNSHEFVHNLTPGGFLRGVTFSVSSASGVLGTTATLNGDAPWSIIQSMTLESVDGTPINYPMGGYSYFLVQRCSRPWDGDPVEDPSYSATVNPGFRMRFFVESRMTIGALPNTDARALYRLRYTVAPLVTSGQYGLVSVSTGVTAPTVTISIYLETYAQPPAADYAGNPIQQVPDGIALQRFCSHQSGDTLNTGTSTIKENRVGNLIRNLILVVRNSSSVRTDLTADPIQWRIDNTQLLSENRDRRDYEFDRFLKQSSAALNTNRPTGVYCYPRWHNPGAMDGAYWLPTTEATYLQFELNGGPSSGTLETITEDLAVAGPVQPYLMGL